MTSSRLAMILKLTFHLTNYYRLKFERPSSESENSGSESDIENPSLEHYDNDPELPLLARMDHGYPFTLHFGYQARLWCMVYGVWCMVYVCCNLTLQIISLHKWSRGRHLTMLL